MTLNRVVRDTVVAAPAPQILALVSAVADWPLLLNRIVHVEPLARDGAAHLAHIWALSANGIEDWVCRVTQDPDGGGLTAEYLVARPPASALCVRWHAEKTARGRSRLTLVHDFEAIGDDPDAVRLLDRLFGTLAKGCLSSLRRSAEIHATHPGCRFAFGETVPLPPGASLDAAFEFLGRPEKWPERLPQITSVSLRERRPGVQRLEMGVEEPDGSVREESTARLNFPQRHLIVQKDLRPRAPLHSHTARYTVESAARGSILTCQHTVVLDPRAVAAELGPEATLADASDKVRRMVSAHSLLTLRHAAEIAGHTAD